VNTSKALAEQHWSYIEKLLLTHGEDEDVVKKIKFHYITSFIHGYKHAITQGEMKE
jgi:hypothetical protein